MKIAIFFFSLSFLLFALALVYYSSVQKDPHLVRTEYNNGKMTKLIYDGHSYVGWSCNFGAGLVHDPDCKCRSISRGFITDL